MDTTANTQPKPERVYAILRDHGARGTGARVGTVTAHTQDEAYLKAAKVYTGPFTLLRCY